MRHSLAVFAITMTAAMAGQGALAQTNQPTVAQAPPLARRAPTGERETVQERYDNGAVKIKREVALDSEMNYIDDGSWQMWDPAGVLLAEGTYEQNRREGVWNRWYRRGDSRIFTQAPYSEFEAPFVSQATFESGRLSGKWIILDARERTVSEVPFQDGHRHGTAIWYFSSGQKLRQIEYSDGLVDGKWMEWAADGKETSSRRFERGRLLAVKSEKFPGGAKKSEAMHLFAPLVEKTADDWWNATFATFQSQGEDVKHGAATSWHPNAQPQMEGEYERGMPIGQFTWWFANGQVQIEGDYRDGKQDGRWNWYHKNGQKSASGGYRDGEPIGKWAQWGTDGRLVSASDYSQIGGAEVTEKPMAPPLHSALVNPMTDTDSR